MADGSDGDDGDMTMVLMFNKKWYIEGILSWVWSCEAAPCRTRSQRKKMQRDIMRWIKLPGSPTFFNQISLFPDFPKVLTHTGQQKIDLKYC